MIKEELDGSQLLDLFRDVRKGFVKWHSWNNDWNFAYKTLLYEDGTPRFVDEDPFVVSYLAEKHQREMWLEALRAIRHGRVTCDEMAMEFGRAVAVMNYHTTFNPEWGNGAEWETCYIYEDEETEEYWVYIGWDGYP